MVADSETGATADSLQALGSVGSSSVRYGQETVQMDVSPSAVSQIAQLPNVLWIQKVEPKRLLDEVQDLVLAGQTNQVPGHGPTPPPPVSTGITYLDFLTNVVGGGLAAFTNSATYPVVDIADTGLDNGQIPTAHPSFNYLGRTNSVSRVVYMMPSWIAGDPLTQLGCQTRLNEKAFKYPVSIEAEDIYGHGTLVASIVAGYDAGTNYLGRLTLELLPVVTNTVIVTLPDINIAPGFVACGQIPSNGTLRVTFAIPVGWTNELSLCNYPTTPDTTNMSFTVVDGMCPTSFAVDVLYTGVLSTNYSEVRRDPDGFQYGMGVSPFGLIGINRLWSQSVTLDTSSGCIIRIDPTSFCVNDIPAIITEAYRGFARIQNNSWADVINLHGSNGGVYTPDSQTYDIAVRDAILPPVPRGTNGVTPGPSPLNQEFAVVFACNSLLGDAGNEGNVGGFADMVVTAPATAKNIISVGSAENARFANSGYDSLNMWPGSAAGPTIDGRFKPEIVAPGAIVSGALSQVVPDLANPTNTCDMEHIVPATPYIIWSTNTVPACNVMTIYDNLYTLASGSSYAAPAVSGGIQLLWWYFQNRLTNEVGHALFQPSPAMAKAYLCNSARYMKVTNPQTGAMDTLPSILQGMGELDLHRMFDGITRVIRDESTPRAIDMPVMTTNSSPQQTYFSQSGQSYEVGGLVKSNGMPFRVTLAWTDVPGNPLAFQQLVNDLDLSVTIGGKTYKGNVFSEDHSVTGGGYDGVNNMESVFLDPAYNSAVTNGARYAVVVQAMNIAGNGVPNIGSALGQDFALVVYNSETNFATLSDVPNLATNNSCATAMAIASNPFSFTNTLSKAQVTGINGYNNVQPSPSAGRGGVDEFFKLELPTPGGVFTVDTTGTTFDNVLSVWRVQVLPQTVFVRGECGALIEVASNAGGAGPSRVTFTADGSNDYYIVVEPHNDGPGGRMVLNVSATAPAITITPSSLVFPDEVVGGTSAVQTVVYQNNTTVKIGVSGVSFEPTNTTDFVIESQGCTGGMGPGQNCSISIAFTPTAGGLRTAQLVINDDATGSPRIVPLSGIGVAPEPNVCLSTTNLVFGNVSTGTVSVAKNVTITNCGTAVLSNIVVSGGGSNYILTDPCSGNSILPAGTCTFNVSFAPATSGSHPATLTISSNGTNSPNTVQLTGTGELPTPHACLSSGASIAFGNQSSGTTSTVHSVTITNCGSAALVLSNAFITGANAGEFILSSDTCSGNNIATNSTCSFGVSFAPTNLVAEIASLIISNNSPINPQVVTLTGTGTGTSALPDLLINTKVKAKTFVGGGIYDPPVRQGISKKVKHGKTGVFYVAVQNNGTTLDSFRIQGAGDSTGFTVKYFLGAKGVTDITSNVVAGVYSTASIAPGAITGDATMIRVVVTVDKTVVKGQSRDLQISGSSNSNLSKTDAVHGVVLVN
jgi:hypothetical protein